MTRRSIRRLALRALVAGGVAAALSASALGQAPVQASLDLQAGLGYSTNPLLATSGDEGSFFGRLSGSGLLAWKTERSVTTLSAYLENSTYLNRYSSKQIFNVAARTEQSVSERLRLFGDLGFSGDFGGMLSSRFFAVPSSPVIPDPTVPESFVIGDPDIFGLTGRQYRISGQVGAAASLSARDSLNASVGAQRVFAGGDDDDLNFNQYDATLGYERQLDERLTVGGRVVVQHSDYGNGGSITSVGPQATIRARISQQWDATAAIGLLRTRQDEGQMGDADKSIDLAFDASLCRNLENERICARAARRSQSTILGGSSTSTSAGVDYYRRLTARDTVQLTAAAVRADGFRSALVDQRSTFLTVAASYNRMLTERLSAGVDLSTRYLSRAGPNPKPDLSGSLFVRYRIGDLQ